MDTGVQDRGALAQATQQPQNPLKATKPEQIQAPSQAPGAPRFPSDQKIAMLIFSSLIALNQANMTGNYSVLREIGAPGFQSNSAARIAEAFTDLRQRNLDLSPVLLLPAKLLGPPTLDAKGMLRVTGFFPTRPERVKTVSPSPGPETTAPNAGPTSEIRWTNSKQPRFKKLSRNRPRATIRSEGPSQAAASTCWP
jgi:hypothetical protein